MDQRRLPRTDRRFAEALESRRLLAFSGGAPVTITGEGYESVDRVLATSDGGYVAAGLFRKTQFSGRGKVRSSADQADAYVVRVAADGAVVWSRTFGSDYDTVLQARRDDDLMDFAASPRRAAEPFVQGVSAQPIQPGEIIAGLAEAPDGSIVLGGSFIGSIDFGNGTGTFTSGDPEYYDAFVLRLDGATGASQRAFTIGGRFNETITAVKVDAQGSLIVAGSFERDADFNPGRARYIVQPQGRGDGFIAKFSVRDKLVWLVPIGSETSISTEIEAVNDIALDADGNVYATGTFAYIADFDAGPGTTELRAVDITDSFTAKYGGTGGELAWVRAQGGDRFDGGRAVAVAPNGQVYSVGYFERDARLNPDAPDVNFSEVGDREGRAGNNSDLFFTSFNADGSVRWVRQLGGQNYELIAGASVDNGGNLVIAGSFTDVVDFDPSKRRVALGSPDAGTDVEDSNEGDRSRRYSAFVARYSPRGFLVDAKQINGKFDQDLFASGLALRGTGEALVVGRYRGGLTSPQQPTLDLTTDSTPSGREDGYLVELV